MMIVMKFFSLLVLGACLAPAATLQDIKTVYVFPMRNSMDQYLASRLTREHVFQVVSNPKEADAVFTDRMGPSFERIFDERVLDVKFKSEDAPPHAAMGSKGSVFLVSKSKQVVWSAFEPTKDSTPKQMEHTARRTVEQLMKSMGLKKSTTVE